MRCTIRPDLRRDETPRTRTGDADYLGLIYLGRTAWAIVKFDDGGMYLETVHPSLVDLHDGKPASTDVQDAVRAAAIRDAYEWIQDHDDAENDTSDVLAALRPHCHW